MAKAFQKSFSGGELTPSLHARADLSKYATGARTIRNAYVGRQGGAYNRPGTLFDTEVLDSDSKVRLLPFSLPGDRHFQLEFGDEYMRPLQNWKPIMVTPKPIFGIAKGTSTNVLTVYHGFRIGDVVTFSSVTGMTQINGLTGTITAVMGGGAEFTVNINSSAFSNFTLGVDSGTVALVTPRSVEFASPYTEDEIFEMTFQQQTTEMVIAHHNHLPQSLKFFTSEYWTFSNASTLPSIGAPTGLNNNGGDVGFGPPTGNYFWLVTAIKADTYEEGYPAATSVLNVTHIGANGYFIVVGWTAVAGAIQYNIYRGQDGITYGLVGTSFGTYFEDKVEAGIDYSSPPPYFRPMFNDGPVPVRPAVVGYYQQRQLYGNLGPAWYPDAPAPPLAQFPYADRILASRVGSPTYFNIDIPTQEDSSISFRLLNKTPQEIRHFLDIGKLLALTEQGAWVLKGGSAGAITPGEINPEIVSSNGCGYVPPIALENYAIYIQKGPSSIIRSLGFQLEVDSYRGDDLTINANHLIDQKQIVSWDFQKSPDPIVWSARDDGIMVGLTLVPTQQISAMHRHDFENGKVECVLTSGEQIGFVIRRTIDGVSKRYIEHFSSREFTDIKEAHFVDAGVVFDGRNTDPTKTVALSGGTTWDDQDAITVTANTSIFSAGMVGQGIHVTTTTGALVRFSISAYTSGTVVTAVPDRTVPISLRTGTTSSWALAQNFIDGLDHLEGQKVSVLADGFVVASPNNPKYDVLTVDAGEVELGDYTYTVIRAGLPITTDIETLSIENGGNGSLVDGKKLITKVWLWLQRTRGVFVGANFPEDVDDPTKDLRPLTFNEIKYRETEGYDEPSRLITRPIGVNIHGTFNNNGRIVVRQVDPLPLELLAVAPDGFIDTSGG